ncbi:MAG: hypothetical protein HY392_02540 [Candidatus Diapherotrites archaeon]|nr:hypothetical protein [Candidatus Diapherotrites archaeon]
MTLHKFGQDVSLFAGFFGDYPIIRVFDFLIENDIFDYSKKDICKNAGVSWNSLETFWPKLEEKNMVVFTRKVGKACLYKLNKENPVAKQLIKLDNQLVMLSLEEISNGKEKVKALA